MMFLSVVFVVVFPGLFVLIVVVLLCLLLLLLVLVVFLHIVLIIRVVLTYLGVIYHVVRIFLLCSSPSLVLLSSWCDSYFSSFGLFLLLPLRVVYRCCVSFILYVFVFPFLFFFFCLFLFLSHCILFVFHTICL